jgi:hypothetical protein
MDARTATSKAETTFHTGDVALMKMLTEEGGLADRIRTIPTQRRPFMSFMLHRMLLLGVIEGSSSARASSTRRAYRFIVSSLAALSIIPLKTWLMVETEATAVRLESWRLVQPQFYVSW